VLCGSPGFFAPEMATAPSYDPFKVDQWSVGCVGIELLLGRRWFTAHWLPFAKLVDEPAVFEPAMRSALARLATDVAAVSPAAASFVLVATTLVPEARPTAEQLSAHAFVVHSPHLARIPAARPAPPAAGDGSERPTMIRDDRPRRDPPPVSVTPLAPSAAPVLAPAPPVGAPPRPSPTPRRQGMLVPTMPP